MKDKYIISKIIGGLGNQMFQYATGKALSQHYGVDHYIDCSEFEKYDLHAFMLGKLNISSPVAENKILKKYKSKINKILRRGIYKEKDMSYSEDVFDLKLPIYLNGYFQSEKYFLKSRDVLLNEFSPKETSPNFNKFSDSISKSKVSCSVHIRRGDYLLAKNTSIHGICSEDYYKKAIKRINETYGDVDFYFFSDDIDWCVKNFEYVENKFFVNGSPENAHEDIHLMASCGHNIIANSSFSWWGAWLNRNDQKHVISPLSWFQSEHLSSSDILCDSWEKM